jgi:hypothetical protein
MKEVDDDERLLHGRLLRQRLLLERLLLVELLLRRGRRLPRRST